MKTALAQLRAKTDRQLAIVIERELARSLELAGSGRYIEAARVNARARSLMSVANLTAQERARLQPMLCVPAVACA
jgi:hypothetical protein